MAFAVRADGDLAALIPAARAAVKTVDPAQAIYDVQPIEVTLSERTIGLQYVAAIMGGLGLLALGLLVSVALGRFLEAALFGVIASDIRLSLGFAAILVLAALSAGYLPARRATAIDPIAALRAE